METITHKHIHSLRVLRLEICGLTIMQAAELCDIQPLTYKSYEARNEAPSIVWYALEFVAGMKSYDLWDGLAQSSD